VRSQESFNCIYPGHIRLLYLSWQPDGFRDRERERERTDWLMSVWICGAGRGAGCWRSDWPCCVWWCGLGRGLLRARSVCEWSSGWSSGGAARSERRDGVGDVGAKPDRQCAVVAHSRNEEGLPKLVGHSCRQHAGDAQQARARARRHNAARAPRRNACAFQAVAD
jgi:hypothetical protein